MKIQTLGGIRLENFAFKFDLNDFLEVIKVKTLAKKWFFTFQKNKKRWERGLTPLFFPRIYTKTCKSPKQAKFEAMTGTVLA